jgi:hypothetical protein
MPIEVYRTLDYDTRIILRGFYRTNATDPINWMYYKGDFDPTADNPDVILGATVTGQSFFYLDGYFCLQTDMRSTSPLRNTGGKIVFAADPTSNPTDILFSYWDWNQTSPARVDVPVNANNNTKLARIAEMLDLGYFG